MKLYFINNHKLKSIFVLILTLYICINVILYYFINTNYNACFIDETNDEKTIVYQFFNYLKWYKLACYFKKRVIVDDKLSLNDLLITVKTSNANQLTRFPYIFETWYQFAQSQTYFVTDTFDKTIFNVSDDKIITTDCKPDHSRPALCCKFGAELNLFFKLNKRFKWFCHVDDDNYINIPNLVEFLTQYDHNKDWYIGRSSWSKIVIRDFPKKYLPKPARFRFATLGAGVCLSNSTMWKIKEYANSKAYADGCEKLLLPDDMYLGYLMEWVKNITFTNVIEFNHHLDRSQFENLYDIHTKVTFGFGSPKYDKTCNCVRNHEGLPEIATIFENDIMKIKTFHCLLFPEIDLCKKALIDAVHKLRNFESNIMFFNESLKKQWFRNTT